MGHANSVCYWSDRTGRVKIWRFSNAPVAKSQAYSGIHERKLSCAATRIAPSRFHHRLQFHQRGLTRCSCFCHAIWLQATRYAIGWCVRINLSARFRFTLLTNATCAAICCVVQSCTLSMLDDVSSVAVPDGRVDWQLDVPIPLSEKPCTGHRRSRSSRPE